MATTRVGDGIGGTLSTATSTDFDPNPLGAAGLGLDVQTVVGDASYTILPTDRNVVTSVALTGVQPWNLPDPASVSAGWKITITDKAGVCVDELRSISMGTVAGSIVGLPAVGVPDPNWAHIVLPYGYLTYQSDGVSVWELMQSSFGERDNHDGWMPAPWLYFYGSATQLGVLAANNSGTGSPAAMIPKGTKVRYSGNQYGHVASTSACLTGSNLTNVTTTIATDLFTKTAHGLNNGDCVWIGSGIVNTAGISTYKAYYVVSTAANTFQLATTIGGAAINLTGTADTALSIRGGTVVTLAATSDYTVPNPGGAPDDLLTYSGERLMYSYADSPQGFPTSFTYAPTFTGYSADPTSLGYHYSINGGRCTYVMRDGANGTSNAATTTMTLPIAAKTVTNSTWTGLARFVDGGAGISALAGFGAVSSGGTTAQFGVNMTAVGGFTATLGKRIVSCTVVYPI